jgi:hypothetical protein
VTGGEGPAAGSLLLLLLVVVVVDVVAPLLLLLLLAWSVSRCEMSTRTKFASALITCTRMNNPFGNSSLSGLPTV